MTGGLPRDEDGTLGNPEPIDAERESIGIFGISIERPGAQTTDTEDGGTQRDTELGASVGVGGKRFAFVEKLFEKVGLDLDASVGASGSTSTRRDADGELTGLEKGIDITPGVTVSKTVSGLDRIDGEIDGKLYGIPVPELSVGVGANGRFGASAGVYREETTTVFARNGGDAEVAKLHMDALAQKEGVDGVLSQFANQNTHAADGTVRTHDAPIADQVKQAVDTLDGIDVDGEPLLAWENFKPGEQPSEADPVVAIDKALAPGLAEPEDFAGVGGLDFGQEDIATANLELHGVDAPHVNPDAENVAYTELESGVTFKGDGTLTDTRGVFRDKTIDAATGEVVSRDFAGAEQVGRQVLSESGQIVAETVVATETFVHGAVSTVYQGASVVVAETYDALDTVVDAGLETGAKAATKAYETAGNWFEGARAALGRPLG